MFALTEEPIDPAAWRARLLSPAHGAFVCFEGRVRDHHQGRAVLRLEYEAFGPLAESEGARILADAEARHPGVRLAAVHRTGALAIGDIAVWIGAASAHRDDAFRAARLVIEEIKLRLPVWKREFFPDADPVWVDPGAPAAAVPGHALISSRHARLPDVGEAGLARLASARLLVAGAGGLGCPALQALAGAGIGRLVVVDPDRVAWSNLNRQFLHTAADIGRPKAGVAAERLAALSPLTRAEARVDRVDSANLDRHLDGVDAVLDCTDNLPSRFALHDGCRRAGVPLFQAALSGYQAVLQSFLPGTDAGCLRCQWPQGAPETCADDCRETGIFGYVSALAGAWQAGEAIRWRLGHAPASATDTLILDPRDGALTRLRRVRRADCPLCADDRA